MKVIFVNRVFWPEEQATAQLLDDLVAGLSERKIEVVVIARRPPCSNREAQSANGTWAKAADYARFYLRSLGILVRLARRGDVVVAMTDPPLLGIGAWLVARLRQARLVHWIQDIHPEASRALRPQSKGRLWAVLTWPRNLSWRRADRCVTLGADMALVLQSSGVAPSRVAILPNWAPRGLAPRPPSPDSPLRRAWGLANRFVVAYSGNLGRVHDLDSVLAAADALRAEPDIVFAIIGDGGQKPDLLAKARRLGLDNVQFHPAQPRAQLGETLAAGDVHLVTLRQGCEGCVLPSKLYGAAAVGRPVFFVGPRSSEPARLISSHGFGRVFEADEIPLLAAALRELRDSPDERIRFGQAAARFAASQGGAEQAAESWSRLLNDLPPGPS